MFHPFAALLFKVRVGLLLSLLDQLHKSLHLAWAIVYEFRQLEPEFVDWSGFKRTIERHNLQILVLDLLTKLQLAEFLRQFNKILEVVHAHDVFQSHLVILRKMNNLKADLLFACLLRLRVNHYHLRRVYRLRFSQFKAFGLFDD